MERWDALVIGGGFYGLYLAETLAARLPRVLLVERGSELMARASYANQARVHAGYHYPRSVLTAARSRANFPRFVDEFRPAVRSDFTKLYAVARRDSKVTAAQFVAAMRRVGAATERATPPERRLFDPATVEDVFRVTEYAFDSAGLKRLMAERARQAGIEVRLNTAAQWIGQLPGGRIKVRLAGADIVAGTVVSCGYANTNAVGAASGLPVIPLKHELTEMALVEVPGAVRTVGVTVMDGPFFSCMPFPPRGLHTLSHVRYTPHGHWYDGLPGEGYLPADEVAALADRRTAFPHMVRDAARYMPALAGCEHRGSLWEVKTVLPRSEADDSRPILFRPDHGIPNYHVVLGGKIDNVYDVADELTKHLGWAAPARVAA